MTTEEIEKAAGEYANINLLGEVHPSFIEAAILCSFDDFKAGAELANNHWREKTKSNLVQLFSDAEFIENLCFSYRHDFGLLGVNKQILIRLECKEWLRAIINNWKEIKL